MWSGDEIVLSIAAGVDDGVIAVEHTNAKFILRQESSQVFCQVEFGKGEQADVFGQRSLSPTWCYEHFLRSKRRSSPLELRAGRTLR